MRANTLKYIINIILMVVVSLACLIALEITLRVLYPVYNPAGKLSYSKNEAGVLLAEKNWVGRQWKNTGDYDVEVQINNYGFRDARDLSQSTADDFFVVGDSFSMGHGVKENNRYSGLLDSMLQEKVYNISIPTDLDGYDRLIGYALDQGATINKLIIGLCMENDLGYYSNDEHYYPAANFYEPISQSPSWLRLRFYLAKYSATYTALTTVVHQDRSLLRVAETLGLVVPNFKGIPFQRYSDELVEGTAQRIEKLLEDYKISDATILIIPSRALWVGDHREEQSRLHDHLTQRLISNNLAAIVDMRPYFERAGNPLSYHFNNDGHWNAKGHRVAAETIYKSIHHGSPAI